MFVLSSSIPEPGPRVTATTVSSYAIRDVAEGLCTATWQVERLMELNEAGAERLRTPSSSDSGVDAEVRQRLFGRRWPLLSTHARPLLRPGELPSDLACNSCISACTPSFSVLLSDQERQNVGSVLALWANPGHRSAAPTEVGDYAT